jgi:hypothetical protein
VADPVEWLRQWVDEGDGPRLDAVTVALSPSRSIGLADAVVAWREHVAKIDRDLTASADDRSVWGAHDFVAALVMRDVVAEGTAMVDPDLRTRIEPAIADVDAGFRRITEPDDDGCLAKVDGRDVPGRGWWWGRIPQRGPVREELQTYYGH